MIRVVSTSESKLQSVCPDLSLQWSPVVPFLVGITAHLQYLIREFCLGAGELSLWGQLQTWVFVKVCVVGV